MMIRTFLTAFSICALLASGVTFAAEQMQKQQMQQQIPNQQTAPAAQCTSPDRVAVTALSLNPPQPTQGQTVTATLTIKNVCNGPLASVPWTIEVGTGGGENQVLGSGTQQNVPAGASFNVTANWTAVPGQRAFLGTADRNNTLHENNNQNRQNNFRDYPVNVAQVQAQQAPTGAAIETQVLDHRKAHLAGANFPGGKESTSDPTCTFDNLGGRDPGYGGWDGSADAVMVGLRCLSSLGGARANFEVYQNFRLKNGWTIVSAVPVITRNGRHPSDVRWDSNLPAQGSDSAYTKIHLWADQGAMIRVSLKVTIQGPQGTNPYQ